MKIGIVTHPLWSNVGGILQNYALQQILKKMGHTPVTINRIMPSNKLKQFLKNIVKVMLGIIPLKSVSPWRNAKKDRCRNSVFSKFINQNIDKIDVFGKVTPDKLDVDSFDAFITGSDQVWRPAYSANDAFYFLDFASKSNLPLMSYAASFGVDKWSLPDSRTEYIKSLLKKFKAISVREYSGITICKESFGLDAQFALDPTLLLSSQDYTDVADDIDIPQKSLVTYILDETNSKLSALDYIEKKKGLKRYDIGPNTKKEVGIGTWLNAICKADFILTDSFHGTVFSIIFNKQFIVLPNERRGNDRIISLISALGLADRVLTVNNQAKIDEIIKDEIDYNKVEKYLDPLRASSLEFLKINLE